MGFLKDLFDITGFVPRRNCGVGWDSALIGQHVLSDALIFLSYLAISTTILFFLQKERWLRETGNYYERAAAIVFVAFIFTCGFSHFFDAMMFYHPAYRASGLILTLTAGVSLASASMLPTLIQRAITLRDSRNNLDQREAELLQLRRVMIELGIDFPQRNTDGDGGG